MRCADKTSKSFAKVLLRAPLYINTFSVPFACIANDEGCNNLHTTQTSFEGNRGGRVLSIDNQPQLRPFLSKCEILCDCHTK